MPFTDGCPSQPAASVAPEPVEQIEPPTAVPAAAGPSAPAEATAATITDSVAPVQVSTAPTVEIPVSTPAPVMRAAVPQSVTSADLGLSGLLGSRGGDGAPAAAPLAWTAVAASRREFRTMPVNVYSAATTATSRPVNPGVGAKATASAANPIQNRCK